MVKNLISCATVVGCITIVPFSYGIKFGNNQIVEKINDGRKERKIGDLVLSKSSKGSSLSIANFDELLEKTKGAKKTMSFKEVGMKFGTEELTENDFLVSPAQDGKYYLAKNVRNGEYLLKNGLIVRRFHERDFNWNELDHVNLDWKSLGLEGNVSLSKIAVGSCTFTLIDDSRLQINCREFFSKSVGSGEAVQGILTFGVKQ
ncbi:hypothetical protein OVS_01770 [Mycoplasma ovis str. Michigan]|uniref:Lipoprotein n=1 Tax=Mycoplasma ovis str. Michigan TaxID=1415773 RepID=A0ABM5P194_9MOLU|nr:hypothetical protein [Mycoplasma ovis]AHC40239.1 hypothetical protein OVS_01770 [Mycoplasma ovis str. Michigan]